MAYGSTLRRFLALSAAAAALGAPALARAQSVTVFTNSVTRTAERRPNAQQPTWISYSDCLVDDRLTFETELTSYSGKTLEVWVGTSVDCSDYQARLGSSPSCWKVYSASPTTAKPSVTVRAQDIIAKNLSTETPSGPSSGTIADCEDEGGSSDPQAIKLYFMLVDGSGQLAGTAGTYETKYDLIGPPAPTDVGAGIGENILVVDWTASNGASDVLGYYLYCDPKPGTTSPANSPMAGGAAGTSGAAGAGGTAGATAAGGTAGATASGGAGGAAGASATGGSAGAATGGSAGATGTGGSGGLGGNPNCPSTALVVGERPDSAYKCGSVNGQYSSEAKAKDLQNGVIYAVGVAAYDTVGNAGPLSAIACGTPQPVDDFFELYRRAGGKGGGGFCSLTGDPAPGAAVLLGIALAAWGARRRRRA